MTTTTAPANYPQLKPPAPTTLDWTNLADLTSLAPAAEILDLAATPNPPKFFTCPNGLFDGVVWTEGTTPRDWAKAGYVSHLRWKGLQKDIWKAANPRQVDWDKIQAYLDASPAPQEVPLEILRAWN